MVWRKRLEGFLKQKCRGVSKSSSNRTWTDICDRESVKIANNEKLFTFFVKIIYHRYLKCRDI